MLDNIKVIVTNALFETALDILRKDPTLFFDIESNGLDFTVHELCGIGVATSDSAVFYFPFRHAKHEDDFENLSNEQLHQLLEVLNNATTLIGYNVKFDLKFLEKERNSSNYTTFSATGKKLIDVLVMVRLTEKGKHTRLGLTDTIIRQFGEEAGAYDKASKAIMRKNKWIGKNTPEDYSLAPINLLGIYCCWDVFYTRELYFSRKNAIEATGQADLWNNISVPNTTTLLAMETRGTRVDIAYAADGAIRVAARKKAVEGRIFEIVGHAFNIASTKQLGEAFGELGIEPVEFTEKGNPSWAEKALVKIPHEMAGRVREHSSLGKVLGTYLEPLSISEILHCTFCNWGTITGRLSSRDRNLQNMPRGIINTIEQNLSAEEMEALQGRLEAIIKANKGRISLDDQDLSAWSFVGEEKYTPGDDSKVSVRNCFIARDGYTLYGFDYKQMEVWVFLSYFMDQEELDALKEAGVDLHDENAKAAFHVDEDHPEWAFYRQAAKNLSFGILYGLGYANLANSLDCSKEEAKMYKVNFLNGLPGSAAFIRQVTTKIEDTGVVFNRFGRKYWIPKSFAYAGVNYLVQGTSADIMAERMNAVHEYLLDKESNILIQVHDELVIEIRHGEEYVIEKIRAIMEINSLNIPLLVDVEKHEPSWAFKEKIERPGAEKEDLANHPLVESAFEAAMETDPPEMTLEELKELGLKQVTFAQLLIDRDHWKKMYEDLKEKARSDAAYVADNNRDAIQRAKHTVDWGDL